ncbi:ABC transporter permease [Solidesulfovibrio sp.]|uniref:ABC transporter permease n=1 Tax=Solidesulfovibrio sp. TaxID=2910990 RepID=UPI002B2178F3|nr:ABC transporter permease subunit [Solidesulfovibrio sp.]MEA4855573.1 ABC transporter permease subunit [Solidesulfovibrio sp.]
MIPPGGVQGQRPWPPGALSGYLLLGLLLLGWEAAARAGWVGPDLLPPASAVTGELWRLAVSGELWRQGEATLGRVLAGFVVGGGLGAALGFGCGVYPGLGRAVGVTAEFLRPMPSVALIPIGILFLGIGFELCVAIAAFACAWPAYVAALAGAGAAGPELRDTARVYGLSPGEAIRLVRLPAALPQVLSGLRVALSVAVAVTVTTEMAASPSGLGSFILECALARRPEGMYAGIAAVGLLGFGVNACFLALRGRLLRWLPRRGR